MTFALIDQIVSHYDQSGDRLRPHEIAGALFALRANPELSEAESHEVDIEIAVWDLRPSAGGSGKSASYYQPIVLGHREDGTPVYRTEISKLNGEALTRWSERCQSVKSPFLRARYADVLWDLTHIIDPARKRDYKSGRIAVDAYIAQAPGIDGASDIYAAMALERALQIATSLNDEQRIDMVAGRLLYLASCAPIEMIGIWSMPSRCFSGNRNIAEPRHQQLRAEMERRLEEAAQITNGYACAVVADYLKKAYSRERDERSRVLRTLADTYERQGRRANAGVAIGWLSSVVEQLEADGMTDDADRLRLIMEQRGPEALREMKTISVETTLDRQEVDDWIETEIAVSDPFLALFRLARGLEPRCESLRRDVKEHEKEFLFYSLMPRTIVGRDGMPKASIGSSDTDMEGRMVEEAMHSVFVTPQFFHLGYVRAKERFNFTPPDLMKVISASYLCSPEISEHLLDGIEAYDIGDYTKAISVIVPQIEAMLRGLLQLMERPIRKPKKRARGLSELKNMNDVLADKYVQDALEEDLLFFLRIVFVDPRGWNLRNEFAHGALPPDAFNERTASVVLMALLALGMIGPHGLHISTEDTWEEQDLGKVADAPQANITAVRVEE